MRQNLSERTRRILKSVTVCILYGWTFIAITLPLLLLKLLSVFPVKKMFISGTPIVRFYWEKFLLSHLEDFHGDAAEIDSKSNIECLGKYNLVINGRGLRSAKAIDIVSSGNEDYVADLSDCWNIPSEQFDLLLVQFTLHMILDDKAALYHSTRILKPGGVLLCNFPAISGYFPNGILYKGYRGYVYRWYTPQLLKEIFKTLGLEEKDYTLTVNGNRIARTLYADFYIPKEVIPNWLLKDDPAVPILISVRIKKPLDWSPIFQANKKCRLGN